MDIVAPLVIGMVLLVGGAEALVHGAKGLARHLGTSPLIIGMTLVAFGTSAPELGVNLAAAIQGTTGLSFGNIIGSNLANIGLAVGLAAMMHPLTLRESVIRRELPVITFTSLAVLFMAWDTPFAWSNGLTRPSGMIDRADAAILLLAFAAYLYIVANSETRVRMSDEDEDEDGPPLPHWGLLLSSVIGGIAVLAFGASLTADSAVELARALGASEVIIGLTVVAIGTSLPEIVTSLVATRHREIDLAIGNIVGSNVFNLLLVGGSTALVRPIAIPDHGYVDLAATTVLSVLLLALAVRGHNRVARTDGVILIGSYLAYVAWRVCV